MTVRGVTAPQSANAFASRSECVTTQIWVRSAARDDHAGERLEQVGVEARLRLVQGDERGQPIAEQRARQREVAQRAVRKLARIEHPLGIVGQHQAEGGRLARRRHHQPGARERVVDDAAEVGGIFADVHQRGEHGGQVGAVGRQGRRRHRQAGLPQRRGAVAAEVVVESPVEHGPAHDIHVRKARGVLQRAERGLGGQQIGPERMLATVVVGGGRARAAPFEDGAASPAVVKHQRLFLDLRLEREGGRGRHPHADIHLVRIGKADIHVVGEAPLRVAAGTIVGAQPDRQFQSRRLVRHALAGPERRFHAALGGELARERAGGRRLQQLQRPIEVGLSDAVGAHEDRERADRKADRAKRPIAEGADVADAHGRKRNPALLRPQGLRWRARLRALTDAEGKAPEHYPHLPLRSLAGTATLWTWRETFRPCAACSWASRPLPRYPRPRARWFLLRRPCHPHRRLRPHRERPSR